MHDLVVPVGEECRRPRLLPGWGGGDGHARPGASSIFPTRISWEYDLMVPVKEEYRPPSPPSTGIPEGGIWGEEEWG